MPQSQLSTQDETGTNLQLWRVPPELKAKFKAKCYAEGLTMKEVVLKFMKKYVNHK